MPYGTILDPIFAAPGSNQIVNYTRCGDSAIWTGHFLAAEAFRYKVTHAPDALANVKKAVTGLRLLMDVTGLNELARCAIPLDSPYAASIQSEERSNGIFTNSSANLFWVGNTSRDQYLGAFFGLAVAYDMVDDASVRSAVSDLVTLLLRYLLDHAWTLTMPDGISTTFLARADQQLTLLQIGRHVNSDLFSTKYDINKFLLGAAVIAPIALEVTSNDSYYKFNLDSIDFYNLLRLESGSFRSIAYEPAYDILRKHTDDQANAFFNMIDRGVNSPDPKRDAETVGMLADWLKRPKRDFFVDLRGKLPSCNDPNEACDPVPVALRPPTDFLWQRNPYQLSGGGDGFIESPGIDYILPYWMARYYGVLGAAEVVSSANYATWVAPESIATVYGASLVSGTAPPDVRVKDSQGNTRPAQVFYSSPAQINFQIPAGTAPGAAALTLAGNSAGVAYVQNVAPGIFSADASGQGVAAAVSLRVAANGQTSSALAFQCSISGCFAQPITLSADTPTYLSLFGTGIRNRSSLAAVHATIAGTNLPSCTRARRAGLPVLIR